MKRRVRKGNVYHNDDCIYFWLYAVDWQPGSGIMNTNPNRIGAYQKWAWQGARQELDAMDFDRRMVAIGNA